MKKRLFERLHEYLFGWHSLQGNKKVDTTGKQISLPLAKSRALTQFLHFIGIQSASTKCHHLSSQEKVSLCETHPNYKPSKKYPRRLRGISLPFFFLNQPATSENEDWSRSDNTYRFRKKTGTICKLHNIQTLFRKQTKNPNQTQPTNILYLYTGC